MGALGPSLEDESRLLDPPAGPTMPLDGPVTMALPMPARAGVPTPAPMGAAGPLDPIPAGAAALAPPRPMLPIAEEAPPNPAALHSELHMC